MNKRLILANMLGRSGVLSVLHRVRQWLKDDLLVIAHHRVLDIECSDQYWGDIELVSESIAGFERQIRFIKQYYNPISLSELYAYSKGLAGLPKNPALITFDDGFEDNYTNAFPVLKQYGVPAVFFLATAHLESREAFWFEWLAHIISSTKQSHFTLPGVGYSKPLAESMGARRTVYNECAEIIKYMGMAERQQLMSEIEGQYVEDVASLRKRYIGSSNAMSWEQCKEMAESGLISFGSHGVSHTIFSQLSDQALRTELLQSKTKIEQETGQDVVALAFPNGQEHDFNEATLRLAKECGYELWFSYMHGISSQKNVYRQVVNRLSLCSSDQRWFFKAMLTMPSVFQ